MDLSWKDGQLQEAVIRSNAGGRCVVRTKQQVKQVSGDKGPVALKKLSERQICFEAGAGECYVIKC